MTREVDTSPSTVSISVIVPTYRRPEALARCLGALARQRYPRERFEVIVVDDGTGSGVEPLVRRHQDQLRVRLVAQRNMGPAVARNHGAAASTGRFLAFTDDDCQPTPGWLGALAERLGRTPDALVGGSTVNALPANPYSTASQLLVGYLYDWYNRDPEAAIFFCSNNMALAADRFQQMDGFLPMGNRAAGEDRELCDRWLERGGRLVWEPQAVVLHAHPLGLRSFYKQHFDYGRGAYYFHRERARRRGRFFIEPLRFYTGLLKHPWQAMKGGSAARQGGLLAFTQVANAAGFFAEACRTGTRAVLGRRPEVTT